jgi:hypothetical protein
MMYAKVENGQVVQAGLPTCGRLSNGCSVSNYHLLSESVLLSEGWLPYEENKPEYNPETQYLKLSGYDIQQDKVVANYTVENMPVVAPDPQIVQLNDSIIGIAELIFSAHPELL